MHLCHLRRNSKFSPRYRRERGDAFANDLFGRLCKTQAHAVLADVRVGGPFRAGIDRDPRLQRGLREARGVDGVGKFHP